MLKKSVTILLFIALIFKLIPVEAAEVPITTFPLDKYNQDINYWINPQDPDYNKPLIERTKQKKQLKEYYKHYYASDAKALSPWSRKYLEKTFKGGLGESVNEQKLIKKYGNAAKNPEKAGYAENFRPYDDKWIEKIIFNINPKQFNFAPLTPSQTAKSPTKFKYRASNRGIAVKNLFARSLPTNEPYFYNFTRPGQGYPFDDLQESAVWVGTPVYIVGKTRDNQWYLVATSSFIAWVESDGVAKVSKNFVATWQKYAKQKMVAITKTNLSVFDINKQYRFNTYVGTVFPGKKINKHTISVLIPFADKNHNARVTFANISKKDAALMPLRATPHNFVKVMSTLLGRPYGWGNMYFYNDCSAEFQNLYTPFGIWLPRNSSAQAKSRAMIDLSSLSMKERIKQLQEKGKKFTTLVYIGGHIVMYIGTYPNPNSETHELIAYTYQTIWGLKPADKSFRAVIGQTVLLPMLEQYPEDYRLNSQANQEYFRLIDIDEPLLN